MVENRSGRFRRVGAKIVSDRSHQSRRIGDLRTQMSALGLPPQPWMALRLLISIALSVAVLYPAVTGRSYSAAVRTAVRNVAGVVPRELPDFPQLGRAEAAVPPGTVDVDSPPAAAVIRGLPPAGSARGPAPGRTRDYKLPAGTTLRLELRTPLNSAASGLHDQVSATLLESISRDGVELIPPGSVLFGKVADIEPATVRTPLGRIALTFTVVEHAESGHRAMIVTRSIPFEAVAPEPADDGPRRRKAKKEPTDLHLFPGHRFVATLAEPLLIRIPG